MSGDYDYGNARIAARRGRLLTSETLDRLAESGSAAAAAAQLERIPAWERALDTARQSAGDAAGSLALAIEHHRAAELGALPRWYHGTARRLVEALVLGLDLERVAAVLRRRRAGQSPEEVNATIVSGVFLDGMALAELARQPSLAAAVGVLRGHGLLDWPEAHELIRLGAGQEHDSLSPVGPFEPARFEAALSAAWTRARERRAVGSGDDARIVRRVIAAEAAEREAVRRELADAGAAGAALVERSLALARDAGLARRARRDPAGVMPAAAYVAAIAAQAVRLRVVVNRVAAGWSRPVAAGYLNAGVG